MSKEEGADESCATELHRLSEIEETLQHQPDLYLPTLVKLKTVFPMLQLLLKGKRTEFVQRQKKIMKKEMF